jgi:hypothetical protein
MADKKQRPVLHKLADMLETRIDVHAWLQELFVQPAADAARSGSRSFGYTPAVLDPVRRTLIQTKARLLVFPARDPRPPKAI